MAFFFSGPNFPGKRKAKWGKINYILCKCMEKHNTISKSDVRDQQAQCSLNFNWVWVLSDLLKYISWYGRSRWSKTTVLTCSQMCWYCRSLRSKALLSWYSKILSCRIFSFYKTWQDNWKHTCELKWWWGTQRPSCPLTVPGVFWVIF